MVQQFDIKNIDRNSWKRYRFDQIAFNISERVEPQQTDLDIYVGLEHIDSDSIHIKRWGTPSDVEGTKLKVYPGDLIFGKRRAYQRKAAIATFKGICSAHAMVLRANPEVIDPQLFPFFIHSDAFMHRAVDISVGSLSPTINWSTLRTQEFLLPPKDQQARLAELLWAGDAVVEGYGKAGGAIKNLIEIFLMHSLSMIEMECNNELLEDLCNKITDGEHLSPKFIGFGKPILSAKDIRDEGVDFSGAKFITEEAFQQSLKRCNPEFEDVLIVSRGATIGRTTINDSKEPFALMGSVILLKPNREKITGRFLVLQILKKSFQKHLLSISGSSAQQAIYLVDLKKSIVQTPPLSRQIEIIDKYELLISEKKKIERCIKLSQKLISYLLNQIFTP